MLYDECANVLLDRHESNTEYLNKSGLPTPWFWSRETLDAVTKQLPLTRRLKYTFSNQQHQSTSAASLLSYEFASTKTDKVPRHIYNWYRQLGTPDDTVNDHGDGPRLEAHRDALEPSPDDNNTW